jgi:hypothetical protein
MNKDKAIITQVAAKIAAELINRSENIEQTCSDWEIMFNFVNDKLQEATSGNDEANISNAINSFNATVVSTTKTVASGGGNVAIAGKQHGDLPNWLISACQKAGVSKVWDNRDVAVGTKRPWFKQADAVDGQEPAAFWPPKGN